MKKIKVKGKILYLFILVLVAMITSAATVYAEKIIASRSVTYDNQGNGLKSTDVQGAIDELYTKHISNCLKTGGCDVPFAMYFKTLLQSDTVIADDGTTDHNMRFTGKTPNNYVIFAGEEWRVIGVFNNIDNGTGKKEMRVKIIKSESLGNKPWDNSNGGIWKSSTLNIELQELSYATSKFVESTVWYLGGKYDQKAHANEQYINERGTTVASGNDPTWTGKVGLMYPSDYGFASSSCKDGSQNLSDYKDSSCTETNWLYSGSHEWLLTPTSTNSVRHIHENGSASNWYTNNSYAVRPVVYLKSSVTCKNCNEVTAGTQLNPFQIG